MTSRSESSAYMAMLPVIDLRHGQVVRGVAGQREAYRPVESCLVAGSSPREIANAFAGAFGFQDVYVADLDAICDDRPHGAALQEIAATGLKVWLDAGIGSLTAWQARRDQYGDWQAEHWIVGLESLESWRQWEQLAAEMGPERLAFSLDLERGVPKSVRPDFCHLDALEIARRAIAMGAEQILLLDLAAVGMGQGVATDRTLAELSAAFPNVCWITGGGIWAAAEVERQQALGAQRVLVASALHAGRIAPRLG